MYRCFNSKIYETFLHSYPKIMRFTYIVQLNSSRGHKGTIKAVKFFEIKQTKKMLRNSNHKSEQLQITITVCRT